MMTQERLLNCIRNGRAPHAILIAGPEGSGRRELARRAAALFCLDEDAPERLGGCPNYTETGGTAVNVEDIRTLLASAAMQGFNGGRRAFVFVNAQNLSAQIQNTLLKTLEEPNPGTMLILTGNEFGLLPTIRSRCVIERLGAKPPEQAADELMREGVGVENARLCAALADGVTGRARAFAAEKETALRTAALGLLERAAFSFAPFLEAAELVTVSAAESAPDDSGESGGKAKSGRKRKKADPALTARVLEIWQSVFRDALLSRLGATGLQNVDRRELVDRIAANFTTARIQGIIELLGTAQRNLAGGANGYLVLDAALAGLFEKESTGNSL